MGPTADQVQQVVREAIQQFQRLAASDQPPAQTLPRILGLLCQAGGCPGAALFMPADRGSENFAVMAETGNASSLIFAGERQLHAAIAAVLQQCRQQLGRPIIVAPGSGEFESTPLHPFVQFFVPIEHAGRGLGVLQLIGPPEVDPKTYRQYVIFTQQAAAAIGGFLGRRQARLLQEDAARYAGILRLIRQLADQTDPDELVHEWVNQARPALEAHRLAVVSFWTRQPRVTFADVIETNRKAVLVRAVRLLAETVWQREVPMTFTRGQELIDEDEGLSPLLEQIFEAGHSHAVCLTPVRHHEKIIAVLVAEYERVEDVGRLTPLQQEIASQVGPLLGRAVQWRQRPLRRLSEAMWRLRSRPMPAALKAIAVAAALAALVWLLVFMPVPMHLRVDARLEPVAMATITAPEPGRVKHVHVRGGERVEVGQLLAEIDDQDLRLRRAMALQQIEEYTVQRDAAMANHEVAARFSADARIGQLRIEVASLERRIERCRITTPIDGVVLTERIVELVGQSMQIGHPLLQIGDLTHFDLVMDLEESDVGLLERRLALGEPVDVLFLSHAWPDLRQQTRITNLAALAPTTTAVPASQVHVLHVTVPLELAGFVDGRLVLANPTGRARLDAGEGNVLDRYGRRAWHYLRMTLLF